MSRPQRIELFLFIACFFAFAYFNQGGGWNQNARFAEVRAVVEEGRFPIDDFLVYKRESGGGDLQRIPVERAEYRWEGQRYRLCWVDMVWTHFPIGEHPIDDGVKKAAMVEACSSGDIGYVEKTGHFHPNKPPGTSLLAIPGYFLIYHVERFFGVNPDHWWYVNLNAWLTSVCSVGLISALGCVLFYRLVLELSGENVLPAVLATLAFAFGTTFFPFSTILFDHDLTASLFICSFYALRRSLAGVGEGTRWWIAGLAGFSAGLSVLTNYVAGLGVVVLGLYALLSSPRAEQGLSLFRRLRWQRTFAFCGGGAVIALVLGWYNSTCYGSPLALSNDFQNPLFRDTGALFGMFAIPHTTEDFWRLLYVARLHLFSPFRGVYFFSPVLLTGLYGTFAWWRHQRRAEAILCLSLFVIFFLVNTFFNGYHAGFTAGPRYLIPGIAFLAMPMVAAFQNWRKTTTVLAIYSIAVNLLLTATDAQNPVGIGGHARVEGRREDQTYNLITEYALPLFWQGRATPLLEQQLAVEMEKQRVRIAQESANIAERDSREKEVEESLRASFDRGELSPFLLGSIRGPVSVNPLGAYEGLFEYGFFEPGSGPCRWASFNVGEFLLPGSRWSLLPLLLISGGLAAAAIRVGSRPVQVKA